MARALKKHVQQSFGIYSKPLDKNGQLRGARKGEKRKHVGRPKRGKRASERHKLRADLQASYPLHVVVRVREDVQPLRRPTLFRAIRRATYVVAKHADMRIAELSIQDTHIHLVVETANKTALAKGMQAFGVSAARNINKALFALASKNDPKAVKRRGSVIADRSHASVLKTPRQVRNCLAYVLGNWRHHNVDRGRAASWSVDPYSSGMTFEGWRESTKSMRFPEVPAWYLSLIVGVPRTWLLSRGWMKSGSISCYEIPEPVQ
ncbi:MAG: transposase [Kofleriaceae bacterium]